MSVTAIVTLWGRPLHSLRWMWHMNRIRFPHPILLADGGPEEGLEEILRDASLFPNLTYRYLRFRDRSVDDYFRKVVETAEQVETPYVMLCDNDDFVLPGGVARALAALEADPRMVASGGRVGGFSLVRCHRPQPMDMVGGPIAAWVNGGTFETVAEPTAMARIEHQIQGKVYGTYYNLQRRDVFIDAWRSLRESGITSIDIGAGEYFAARVLTHGPVTMDPGSIIHLRQMDTSSVGIFLPTAAERWADPKWQADLHRMADALAKPIAQADGIAPDTARARVLELMTDKRKPKGAPARHSPLRRALRALGAGWLAAHWRIHRERATLSDSYTRSLGETMDLLVRSGATDQMVAGISTELDEVRATLASPDMAAFVAGHAKGIRT